MKTNLKMVYDDLDLTYVLVFGTSNNFGIFSEFSHQ